MQLVYFVKLEIIEKECSFKESKPYAIVRLRRDSKEQQKSSSETDFFNYVVKLKELADAEGRIRIQKIRNPEQYDRDLEALLADEDNKIREAIRKLVSSQFRFDFNWELGLAKVLSESRDLSDPDVAGLRTHYFEVF